jgi:tryptophan halogenase
MKKKIVILGSGTAGLIAATILKRTFLGKVEIDIFYDKSRKNISVGESTTPAIFQLFDLIGMKTQDVLKEVNSSIKLGVQFDDWVEEGKSYFHGFQQIRSSYHNDQIPLSAYSILNDCFDDSCELFCKPLNKIPRITSLDSECDRGHAYQIDTQDLSRVLEEKLQGMVNFIDDVAINVNVKDSVVKSIDFKNSGNVTADLYIDASGFNAAIFKHLNPEWVDISNILPIDRAIPQQVQYDFKEVPSYTVCKATKNGWIWKIPIGKRYGTGYLYSSKFTSDEEARKDYDLWLTQNFGVGLETDRIIKYKPGYYKDYWIGNCISIGLSSGFIEPLESTGIWIIIHQILNLTEHQNLFLKNSEMSRKVANKINLRLYNEMINFVALHYATNRTDSDFWIHMKNNRCDFVNDLEKMCKEYFFTNSTINTELFPFSSYCSIANGINLITKEGLNNFLYDSENYDYLIRFMAQMHMQDADRKTALERNYIDHKTFIEDCRGQL